MIGGFHAGMDSAQARAALGDPDTVDLQPNPYVGDVADDPWATARYPDMQVHFTGLHWTHAVT